MKRTALGLALVLALGCDDNGTTMDAGTTDAGRPDTGMPSVQCPRPPMANVPAPEEQMLPCCYRFDQSGQQDAPEMRLTYLRLTEPAGSVLTSTLVGNLLNTAIQEEGFNWLFRVEGAEDDGPVTIVTGFGRREAARTYAFSSGAASGDPDAWCPVQIGGTLSGETVTSEPLAGSITVPVFDEESETVQFELVLRQVEIVEATWSEMRNCVGERTRNGFEPGGRLRAFIEVDVAKMGMISTSLIETSVCTAIAGPDLSDITYCDTTPQSEWSTKPNALCDDTGCRLNTEGMTDVCDPDTTCNAWLLAAEFAAAGVDISNGLCGG